MFRYFTSILFLLSCLRASAQDDTVNVKPPKVEPTMHQLRFCIDVSRPVSNMFAKDHTSYEFTADYRLPKDVYGVIEAGWGGSNIDYDDLKYTSTNSFFRIGVERSMLPRKTADDWDMVFVGVRYGLALIQRSEATYVTNDHFWGTTTGTIPSKSFSGHWAELTAGIRLELWKGIFTGWSIRGKFLFNQSPFRQLPPAYVAGYGKGEKNTIFDFNFYLGYGLRWSRHVDHAPTESPVIK